MTALIRGRANNSTNDGVNWCKLPREIEFNDPQNAYYNKSGKALSVFCK